MYMAESRATTPKRIMFCWSPRMRSIGEKRTRFQVHPRGAWQAIDLAAVGVEDASALAKDRLAGAQKARAIAKQSRCSVTRAQLAEKCSDMLVAAPRCGLGGYTSNAGAGDRCPVRACRHSFDTRSNIGPDYGLCGAKRGDLSGRRRHYCRRRHRPCWRDWRRRCLRAPTRRPAYRRRGS
jgi:hypothetical protein